MTLRALAQPSSPLQRPVSPAPLILSPAPELQHHAQDGHADSDGASHPYAPSHRRRPIQRDSSAEIITLPTGLIGWRRGPRSRARRDAGADDAAEEEQQAECGPSRLFGAALVELTQSGDLGHGERKEGRKDGARGGRKQGGKGGTSSTSGTGRRGLGMGMKGTPAKKGWSKSKSKSKSIGVHSTPNHYAATRAARAHAKSPSGSSGIANVGSRSTAYPSLIRPTSAPSLASSSSLSSLPTLGDPHSESDLSSTDIRAALADMSSPSIPAIPHSGPEAALELGRARLANTSPDVFDSGYIRHRRKRPKSLSGPKLRQREWSEDSNERDEWAELVKEAEEQHPAELVHPVELVDAGPDERYVEMLWPVVSSDDFPTEERVMPEEEGGDTTFMPAYIDIVAPLNDMTSDLFKAKDASIITPRPGQRRPGTPARARGPQGLELPFGPSDSTLVHDRNSQREEVVVNLDLAHGEDMLRGRQDDAIDSTFDGAVLAPHEWQSLDLPLNDVSRSRVSELSSRTLDRKTRITTRPRTPGINRSSGLGDVAIKEDDPAFQSSMDGPAAPTARERHFGETRLQAPAAVKRGRDGFVVTTKGMGETSSRVSRPTSRPQRGPPPVDKDFTLLNTPTHIHPTTVFQPNYTTPEGARLRDPHVGIARVPSELAQPLSPAGFGMGSPTTLEPLDPWTPSSHCGSPTRRRVPSSPLTFSRSPSPYERLITPPPPYPTRGIATGARGQVHARREGTWKGAQVMRRMDEGVSDIGAAAGDRGSGSRGGKRARVSKIRVREKDRNAMINKLYPTEDDRAGRERRLEYFEMVDQHALKTARAW